MPSPSLQLDFTAAGPPVYAAGGPMKPRASTWYGGPSGLIMPTMSPDGTVAAGESISKKCRIPRKPVPVTAALPNHGSLKSARPHTATPVSNLYSDGATPTFSRSPTPYEGRPEVNLEPIIPRLPPRLSTQRGSQLQSEALVTSEEASRHIREVMGFSQIPETAMAMTSHASISIHANTKVLSGQNISSSVTHKRTLGRRMSFKSPFQARKPSTSSGRLDPDEEADPRDVFEAMPSAYWTGRYISLKDKSFNEHTEYTVLRSENEPREPEAAKRARDSARALRIFEMLEGHCKTEEAKKSLLHYRQHFAVNYGLPDVAPSIKVDEKNALSARDSPDSYEGALRAVDPNEIGVALKPNMAEGSTFASGHSHAQPRYNRLGRQNTYHHLPSATTLSGQHTPPSKIPVSKSFSNLKGSGHKSVKSLYDRLRRARKSDEE